MKVPGKVSIVLLIGASVLLAQSKGEEAAYRKVAAARDSARRFNTIRAAADFANTAKAFLADFPASRRAGVVRLWMGDTLKSFDPREALQCYEESGEPGAAERAADLAFRHEAPPPLEIEEWIGEPPSLDPGDGTVKALVFFSESHAQTRELMPRLHLLHQRLSKRGLKIVAIASIVDDPVNQTPELLKSRIQRWELPFPVGIDKQRARRTPSASLKLYRGNLVPWVVVLDRYGRIQLLEGMLMQGNGFTRLKKTLLTRLDEPSYEELVGKVRSGDMDALKTLAAVRTRDTADALIRSREGQKSELVLINTDDELRSLLPQDLIDDYGFRSALDLWPERRERYRYSLAADRLVRRKR